MVRQSVTFITIWPSGPNLTLPNWPSVFSPRYLSLRHRFRRVGDLWRPPSPSGRLIIQGLTKHITVCLHRSCEYWRAVVARLSVKCQMCDPRRQCLRPVWASFPPTDSDADECHNQLITDNVTGYRTSIDGKLGATQRLVGIWRLTGWLENQQCKKRFGF